MLGLLELAGVNHRKWTVDVIGGFVSSKTAYFGALSARLCLISRMSRRRAGTRFSVRGLDDEGNVANHVETEQLVLLSDARSCSFLILRGSVPLFWEQSGTQVGAHKVTLSRGEEASFPAFLRHVRKLRGDYGEVFVLNLLGGSAGEFSLTYNMQEHIRRTRGIRDYFNFDYHGLKGAERDKALHEMMGRLTPFVKGSFFRDSACIGSQFGIIRVNCIDCLDRTNSMQRRISLEVFRQSVTLLGIELRETVLGKCGEALEALWSANGHAISQIYAGTDSLDFQKSKATNVLRSAGRVIQSSMFDSRKNAAISFLLLNSISTISSHCVHSHTGVLLGPQILKCPSHFIEAVERESAKFCRRSKLRVFVGTWNVNGMSNYQSIVCKGDIGLWLREGPKVVQQTGVGFYSGEEGPIDLYAIGFQEMVDLTAANIISGGGNSKRLYWADEIKKKLSAGEEFCLVTSLQLVGVCLFIFARQSLLGEIRHVLTGSVKTGVEGTAGNKGGVAIRMRLRDSTLCFVCSHLAAGQSNVAERNANFNEILRKMSLGNLSIGSHDFVFWCGDLNYRIDLPRETVFPQIALSNWHDLFANDQLREQKSQGLIFKNFMEGPLNFPPTYKYDLYLSDYDTSDKCRVPAWTDRILWMSTPGLTDPSLQGRLIYYGRAELVTSDHRPVGAIIEIDVEEVVQSSLEETALSLLNFPFDRAILVSPFSPQLLGTYHSHFSAIGHIQELIPLENRLIIGYSDPVTNIDRVQNTCINRVRLDVRHPLLPNWRKFASSYIGIETRDLINVSHRPKELPNKSDNRFSYRNLYNLGSPGAPPV